MVRKISFIALILLFSIIAAACNAHRSQVAGQVWQDDNGDGLKAPEEPWLSGVEVSLYREADGQSELDSSTKSNENGEYRFSIDASVPDKLEIRVSSPNGASFTKQNASTGVAIDSDVDASGSSGAFTTTGQEEDKIVNAGILAASQVAAGPEPGDEAPSATSTAVPTLTPTAAPTIAPTATPSPEITSVLTTTTELSAPAVGPGADILVQRVADGQNDPFQCDTSFPATADQELVFDVAETGWVLKDNKIHFFQTFTQEIQPLLDGLTDQDYLGIGWGFYDPEAEIVSEQDPGWLSTVSGNNSFDVYYDPAAGELVGTLFTIQDGAWIEHLDIEYPVTTSGPVISMTIPISHVPPNTAGYSTAVYFDAEEGQLACDWAAVDETAYRQTLESLITSSDSVEPENFAVHYSLLLPDPNDVDSDAVFADLPSPRGTFIVTNTVSAGEIHEIFVDLENTMILTVTHGSPLSNSLELLGDGNWVDVSGHLSEDGSFFAAGTGFVAGFSDIEVILAGTIDANSLNAVYTMGDGGGLPQQIPIVFDVVGQKPNDLPLESNEPRLAIADKIIPFIDEFNGAFQTQNVGFLFDNLHPVVIELYGGDACQNYLQSVIGNPISVQVHDISGPDPWDWERDNLIIPVENAFTLDVTITVGEQTQDQEFHLADVRGHIAWFTDCGEPQP